MSNVQKHIWQRTAVNRYAGITTRIFLDEFHLLLKEPQTAAYTAEIYKRFRKWNGIPTSPNTECQRPFGQFRESKTSWKTAILY